MEIYRDFEISPAYHGYEYAHTDFDGAPFHALDESPADPRSGWGKTEDDCKEQIDEWWDEEDPIASMEYRLRQDINTLCDNFNDDVDKLKEQFKTNVELMVEKTRLAQAQVLRTDG